MHLKVNQKSVVKLIFSKRILEKINTLLDFDRLSIYQMLIDVLIH
jgi:hypothetical protein